MGKGPDVTGAARITAEATKYAADLQKQAQKEALEQQFLMFNKQQEYLGKQDEYNKGITIQNQANYRPYIDQGQKGLGLLSSAITDENSWLNKKFDASELQNDEGYQFRLQQGQSALNNSLAAKGGLLSGAAIKASNNYNQGFASNEYSQAYQRFTNDKNNRYNQLNNFSNLGLQGASGFAGGSPQSTSGTEMANVAGNYGNNVANMLTSGANAQSNIAMAGAQQQAQYAMSSGGSSGIGSLLGGIAGAFIGGPKGVSAGMALGGLL